MIWALAGAAVVIVVAVACTAVIMYGVQFPWGHPPDGSEVLIGTWEGSHDLGKERLILREDHTFSQYLYGFSDLEPRENAGVWEYKDGALRLSLGLFVLVHEYVVSPMHLLVENTIFARSPSIRDDSDATLLFKKR